MSDDTDNIYYPEVTDNYKDIKFRGKGAYGISFSASDRENNQVIIKVIKDPFEYCYKALSCLREMSILRQLNHPNLPKLYKVLRPPDTEYSYLSLIEEDCGTDLGIIASISPRIGSWSAAHIKFIIYELFRTLKYLHSAQIVHRDIKPSNILLNSIPKLTLIDFGLSRQISSEYIHDELPSIGDHIAGVERVEDLTPEVVTRNYRAPELSLKQGRYDGAIDVFSVGCVIYELFQTLQPHADSVRKLEISCLFRSEIDSLVEVQRNKIPLNRILERPKEHIQQIISVLGTPNEEDLEFVIDEELKRTILELRPVEAVNWNRMLPYLNEEERVNGVDLMKRCLEFNPHNRISVDEALNHPYLSSVRNKSEEITFSGGIDFYYENLRKLDEDTKMTALKEYIANEINYYY